MKKLILFAAILFAGVSVVNAQESTKEGDDSQSKLTVTLAPFQHIAVSGEALIEYAKQADYVTGTTVAQTKSSVLVKVSSAGGFTVSAKADDLKEVDNEKNSISSEYITVSATPTTDSPVNSIKSLSNLKTGGVLIKAKTGGMDISYNLKFEANGGDFYRVGFNNGSSQTKVQTYTTTVIYSVVAS